MRIYNGTNSQVDLPLAGGLRITIAPKSVSGDIMSSTDLLSLLVTSYRTDELALVISGPFEINMCASIPATTEYVVQSLDEAIQRFSPKEEQAKVEPEPEPKKEEEPFPLNLTEEPGEVDEEMGEEEEKTEEVVEKEVPKKKKGSKKNK